MYRDLPCSLYSDSLIFTTLPHLLSHSSSYIHFIVYFSLDHLRIPLFPLMLQCIFLKNKDILLQCCNSYPIQEIYHRYNSFILSTVHNSVLPIVPIMPFIILPTGYSQGSCIEFYISCPFNLFKSETVPQSFSRSQL